MFLLCQRSEVRGRSELAPGDYVTSLDIGDVETEVVAVGDLQHEQVADVLGQVVVLDVVVRPVVVAVVRGGLGDEPRAVACGEGEAVLLEIWQDLRARLVGELLDALSRGTGKASGISTRSRSNACAGDSLAAQT